MFGSWRYKRYHVSVGIGALCTALLVGVSLAQAMHISQQSHIWLYTILILMGAVALYRVRWYTFVVIILCGIAIGILRGADVDHQLSRLESLQGKSITVRATITEDPQQTVRGDTRIVLGKIVVDDTSYDGTIWATVRNDTLKRGDTVVVQGSAKPGFGVYQLTMSYAKILTNSASDDIFVGVRDAFSVSLRRVVVEPAASLGIGFVVGQKTSLPPDLEDQLRIVGLTHLVVASGYNLTILIRFAKRLFEKHSKFLVNISSVLLVLGFVGISGASPSMVRASLVAGLSLLAWNYGRRFHPVLLIVYVAALTALINPLYLWADIGWWLSFLAFFGVLVVSPLILHVLYRTKKSPAAVQLLSETIAAQIMTLPLILLVFGSLPVLSVLANLVSAPLIPLAMVLTTIAGVGSMLLPFGAQLVAIPAEILLSYFVSVVRILSSPDWAQLDVSISWQQLTALYAGCIAIVIVIARKTTYRFRADSVID